MNTLAKYIPPAFIISLLAFIFIPRLVHALPSVPTVPPVSQNDLTVPTVPSAPERGEVPTVPPVPTTPGTCCGGATPTSQPQVSPTTSPENGGNGSTTNGVSGGGQGGISTTSENGGEEGVSSQEQVLGLSKTSGDITGELTIMLLGLVIAFFGFRNVLSQKILKK